MLIEEKDLFDFIFYPGKLPLEKHKYITEHETDFKDEIELMRLTKNSLNEDVSESILDQIMNKIENSNSKLVIELFKEKTGNKENNEQFVLAADSPKLERIIQTDTFKDKDSHYLVKVISNNEHNKIFVFNHDNTELTNFTITLEPSGNSYNIESSAKPFLIKPKQNIDKISLVTN